MARMQKARFGTVAVGMLAILAAGGCATSSSGGSGGSADVLTHEQLVESRQSNLYLAVQSLRPRWLRTRGTNSLTSASEVAVFVNEAPFGTVRDLANIPIDAVVELRYMSAGEAGARYGTAAGSSGLILVRTSS